MDLRLSLSGKYTTGIFTGIGGILGGIVAKFLIDYIQYIPLLETPEEQVEGILYSILIMMWVSVTVTWFGMTNNKWVQKLKQLPFKD